jgi:glycosyltransferase involved in cell wall biosynthesis
MTLAAPGIPKRIAFVAPTLAGVLRDRANLIRSLTARGHSVLVVAASQLAGEVAALHHLGGEHRNFDPQPPGMAIFANRKVVQAVRDILAAWKADTAIVSGERLASLAATAARKAGVQRVVTIAGGLGLENDEGRARVASAYRRAVKLSAAVVVHNADDARVLKSVLMPAAQVVVTPGDGVDLEAFAAAPLPGSEGPVVFLMIADPDLSTAIEAYTQAARELTGHGLAARFELATDREMAQDTTLLTVEGVTFHGRAANPAALLASAHVAVHLSADDGSPAALKQALAVGRPVLTLDVPGCRDMVDERVNGCLVPPGDDAALMAALSSFVVHRDLLPAESRAARAKAVAAFGAQGVLEPVVAAIEG